MNSKNFPRILMLLLLLLVSFLFFTIFRTVTATRRLSSKRGFAHKFSVVMKSF